MEFLGVLFYLVVGFFIMSVLVSKRRKAWDKTLEHAQAQRALPQPRFTGTPRVIPPTSNLRSIPLPVIVTSPIGAHVYELSHAHLPLTLNVTPERLLLIHGTPPQASMVLARAAFVGELFTHIDAIRTLWQALGHDRELEDVPDDVRLVRCRIDGNQVDMTLHVDERLEHWANVITWLRTLQTFLSFDVVSAGEALLVTLQAAPSDPDSTALIVNCLRDHFPETYERLEAPDCLDALHTSHYMALIRQWNVLQEGVAMGARHLTRLRTLTEDANVDLALHAAVSWHSQSVRDHDDWEPLPTTPTTHSPHPLSHVLHALAAPDAGTFAARLDNLCNLLCRTEVTSALDESLDLVEIELHTDTYLALRMAQDLVWPFDFTTLEPHLDTPHHSRGFARRLMLATTLQDTQDEIVSICRKLFAHTPYAHLRACFEVATRARRAELADHAPFFELLATQTSPEHDQTLCTFVCTTWHDSSHLPSCLNRWLEQGNQALEQEVLTQLFTGLAHKEEHADMVLAQLARHPEHPDFFTALGRLTTDHPSTRAFLILNPDTTPAKRVELMKSMRPTNEAHLEEVAELALSRLVISHLALGHQEQRLALELLEQYGGIAALRAIVKLIDNPGWTTHQDHILAALDTLKQRHPHITQGALSLDEDLRGELTLQ